MIRRLRIKFIVAAVFSLFVVLACIIGISAAVSYNRICSDSDRTLCMLSQNGGKFADKLFKPEPELTFESRYFTVDYDIDGKVVSANTDRIAAVDEETAVEYASELMDRYRKKLEGISVQDYGLGADAGVKPGVPEDDIKSDRPSMPDPASPMAESMHEDGRGIESFKENSIRGFKGNYRYAIIRTHNGISVLFLDCRRSLDGLGTFALSAATASFSGICAVAVLVTLLSGKIVKPVAESYEKQRRFITDAGHEIKTPLAIINADADILLMDIGEDNEWLGEIKHQVRHLTELTNDLISLSRMEETVYDKVNVDLSELVNEELKAFAGPAAAKSLELKHSIAGPCTVSGDAKMLRRLVSILLDNAVKYSPAGGVTDAELKVVKGQIIFSISNAAEELDEEKIGKLFDRFYRADSARNSEQGGFGIGLSMAKAITEAHGGKIRAYLSEDKLFTVEFRLPAAKK